MTRLPYNVVTAEYDKPLDKVIMISANPNELHVYDYATQNDEAIPLAMPPLSVSVRPDGMYAAVGHDGWVSLVDLQAGRVVRVIQVITDVHAVILASNGYMYLFPARGWSDIYSLQLSSGTVTATNAIYMGREPRLSRDGNYLYVGGDGFSKWSISKGVATPIANYFSFNTCGNLWLAEDGSRMFTACAKAYRVSSVPADDLQPNGGFSGASALAWADQSPLQQSIAVIPQSNSFDVHGAPELQIYGDGFLDFSGSIPLPKFTVGGAAYTGYGQYVFWNRPETTLIVIAKADSSAGLASAYGLAGIPFSAQTQTSFDFPDRGGASVTTGGGLGLTAVGYALVQPNSGSVAPVGLAIFGSRQNGELVSEASVPLSSPIMSGRLYSEVSNVVRTGLAIANPGSEPANLTFHFTDENGVDANIGTTTLPARGQISAFLNEAPFNGSMSQSGTFTFVSDVPVGAVALRGLVNERSEFLWTTLPVSPLGNRGGGMLVFPNFADGGGWKTLFVLVNPTEGTISGTMKFYSQGSSNTSGTPLTVTLNGQPGSTFPYSIPPRTARKFETSGTGKDTLVGAVRVLPDVYTSAPSGLAIFADKSADGTTISEAGVAATVPGQEMRLYAEASADPSWIQTGIAIANATHSPVDVTLELNSLSGASTGLTGSLTVPADGQTQLFLNQVHGFENMPATFRGVLKVSASAGSGVYLVGLRARINGRNEFLITTTMPSMEGSTAAASTLFPHLADGGGYTTQFILFNSTPGQSPKGVLQYFGQGGQPLSLTIKKD